MLDMFISGELMNAEHLCLITTASQTPDGSIAQYFGLTLFFFLQPVREAPLPSTSINAKQGQPRSNVFRHAVQFPSRPLSSLI